MTWRRSLLILLLIFLIFMTVWTISETRNAFNIDLEAQATAQFLLENPNPLPDFVLATRVDNESDPHRLCLTVYQGALWHQDDDPNTLEWHLVQNSTLKIDNWTIEDKGISKVAMFPRDNNGRITDKFGANLDFCIVPRLNAGIHLVTFETTSLRNEQFSYTFALSVNENGELD